MDKVLEAILKQVVNRSFNVNRKDISFSFTMDFGDIQPEVMFSKN